MSNSARLSFLLALPLLGLFVHCQESAEPAEPADAAVEDAAPVHPPFSDATLSFTTDAAKCDEPTEEGLLNGRLRVSKLGPPCSVDYECSDGGACVRFLAGDGGLFCVDQPCDALACTACEYCNWLDSYPQQFYCRPNE